MNKNKQEFLIQKIRTQYTEKEHTDLDTLKELDAEVKRPANIFAYVFGGFGAIILGSGMSVIMTDIGGRLGNEMSMVLGIIIGAVGLLMMIFNYPIYNHILDLRHRKYADEIIALSDKIMEK